MTKTTIAIKTSKVVKRTGFKVSDTPYDVVRPAGFNFIDYKPLKKRNFVSEELYYNHRVEEMNYKAGCFEKLAETARTQGSAADRRKKKQIVQAQEKMAELRKQLEGQGIDVDAILAAASAEAKS